MGILVIFHRANLLIAFAPDMHIFLCQSWRRWSAASTLFTTVSLLKLLLLAPGMYHSTDFEVHRNWLAVTYARPLNDWYWEDTSEWTLDYPPLFGYFQWMLSQVAIAVEPDLVKISPSYEPSEAAIWFQRVSVIVMDVALLLGVMAWCCRTKKERSTERVAVGALVLLNSGLIMVDHVHFQYNGFLLGVLLLSIGLIAQGRVLLGGAAFASLLMLKHLFLSLAPIYFVYLLRGYCCDMTPAVDDSGNGDALVATSQESTTKSPSRTSGGHAASRVDVAECSGFPDRQEEVRLRRIGMKRAVLFMKRLVPLGLVVLFVFGVALGPLCVSAGWTKEACARQLNQLAVRLFPFGRGLVHAYWAPNVWAIYLFVDRLVLAALKLAGVVNAVEGTASTTGGLVRTEVMGVLPAVPAVLCLLLSLVACCPTLWKAWWKPSTEAFVWGVVHCSLSAFLVGFHVHEKALLVPAVVSALLAFQSRAGARMYLRLSFLAAFSVFPLLPGPELRALKVLLVTMHMASASSLLQHQFPAHSNKVVVSQKDADHDRATSSSSATVDGFPLTKNRRIFRWMQTKSSPLWTPWDMAYVAGAACVFAYAEMLHPILFGMERLPFLPLIIMSVYGALGVTTCWIISVVTICRMT